LRITHSLLSFFRIKIGVVVRELLERDQEITQVSLELVQVVGVCEQAKDKLLDLRPKIEIKLAFVLASKLISSEISKGERC
jgi:hypothetical protein